jgi:hypothetical protein
VPAQSREGEEASYARRRRLTFEGLAATASQCAAPNLMALFAVLEALAARKFPSIRKFSHAALRGTNTMSEIYRVPVPKAQLKAIPPDERNLLLLASHAVKQLSVLRKLLIFSLNY